MKRKLFNITAALSLLLMLATVVLWVASSWNAPTYNYIRNRTIIDMANSNGHIYIGVAELIHGAEPVAGELRAGMFLHPEAYGSYAIEFLGFGYHPANVRRLKAFNTEWNDERKARQVVAGTSQGIEAQELSLVHQKILNGNVNGRALLPIDCFTFLRRNSLVE